MSFEKFKKIVFSNGGLKIVSIVLALISWFLITTLVSQNASRTIYNVPVSTDLEGTTAAFNGLVVSGMSNATVEVKVTGKFYAVKRLKASDLRVTLRPPGVLNTQTLDVDIRVEKTDTGSLDFQIENFTPKRTKVTFDRLEEKTFYVQAFAPNVTVPEGFLLGNMTTTPSEISVRGPKSEIDRIHRCVIENLEEVELEHKDSLHGDLKFYDENDKELTSTQLVYPIEVYTIDIQVYKPVTLPLVFDYINVPEGVDASKLNYAKSEQTIDVGIPIDEQDIPQDFNIGTIDFRTIDLMTNVSFQIRLNPRWQVISVPDSVNVEFLSDGLDEVKLSSVNIIEKNKPLEYEISLLTKKLHNIKIVGDRKVIEKLSDQDVVVTIDYSAMKLAPGNKQIPVTSVSFQGEKQAWAVGEYTVTANIKERT